MAPTYSGTYDFFPATGQLVLAAYARIGVRRTEIVSEHLENGRVELNLMAAEWSNTGPNLWTVELQTIALNQGDQIITAPTNTVTLLDAYISTPDGQGGFTDRIITPFSRTEYASQPNKLGQGTPTSYWFNRQIIPLIYLWPVPDDTGPYTLSYYTFSPPQDSVLSGALNPQIPYRFLDAYVAGLAYRLARIYAPALEQSRGADSQTAYRIAASQDTEGTNLAIQPDSSSYWS